MPRTVARRFTLADAMILVAATAVGLALAPVLATSGRARGMALKLDQHALMGLLISWTIALLVLRLRRPRPRLRRLAVQPGFIAGAAASATLAMLGPLIGLASYLSTLKGRGGDVRDLVVLIIPQVGFAVAGAWLAVALSGRRRPEPGWIDGLGRFVGALWLVGTGVLWTIVLVR